MKLRIALAAITLLGLTGEAFADRVITIDNRVLTPKKAREKDGGYVLEFEHGTIVLPSKSLVKTVEIEGDMSDYVPANDDEKQKLAQGFVKYKGKWLSKPGYADELRREAEVAKKRADDIAAHATWDTAWTKETQHFVFQSNTSPELLDHYAELIEAYYALMDNRFGISPGPALRRTKMSVKIFKNKKEFLKIAEAGSPSVLGYFNRATQELCLFHNYAEPSQTEWVALHECTHLLTYLIDPQYFPQIWLNEAVADYFGSSEIFLDKKGKLVINPGTLQNDRVLTVQNAIKDGNDTKLDTLFDISRDDFDGFQYAHAWSFIYFLNNANPKYKKAFDKFFKDLYTGAKRIKYERIAVPSEFDKSGVANQATAQEIRRVVLGDLGVKDIATIEKEWKDFVKEITLDTPEQRFKRAYIQVVYRGLWDDSAEKRKEMMQQAYDDLNFAIENGIKTARAYSTRAAVLRQMNRDDEAKADVEKAVELEPLNARYRWDLGQAMYKGFVGFADEDWGTLTVEQSNAPKVPEDALMQFGLAKELDPETYGTLWAKLPKQ
jgi:hypothetical protein